MATLKDIKGTNIQFLDADPVEYVGTWSSGGTLNTARKDLGSFGAGATNGIAAGGYGGGGASAGNYVESYNGTSWTETTELNAGRGWSPAGAGTQTAGFVAGGQPLPPGSGYTGITEEWDGSSWTESGDLNIARAYMNAAGTQTAGIGFGGNNPSPTASRTDTEKFNGTAWTEANNMNNARASNSLSSRGSPQSSVICVLNAYTEVWDGTNWTETTEVNTPRAQGGGAGASSTSAVIYGGAPAIANTETWDGTAWTEGNDLSAGRADGGTTGGTYQNALYAGGEPPSYTGATEEWAFPPTPVSQLQEGLMWFNSASSALKGYGKAAGIPAATWASGTNFPSATYGQSGFGTQTSAMIAGGPTALSNTQVFNGTTFTAKPAMNTASPPNSRYFIAAIGATDGAGIMAGGEPGEASAETWNGSAWTEVNNLNTGRNFQGAMGVSTAGLAAGGYTSTARTADTETWDGTSWTEVSNLNTARRGLGGAGSQTSGIAFGGNKNPNNLTGETETWDGSSWTEPADMNTGREFFGAYGPTTGNTSAMVAGGLEPGNSANTEVWNGSSWTEVNNLSTARRSQGAGGTAMAAVLTTGESPSGSSNATELFTADNAVSTITTS